MTSTVEPKDLVSSRDPFPTSKSVLAWALQSFGFTNISKYTSMERSRRCLRSSGYPVAVSVSMSEIIIRLCHFDMTYDLISSEPGDCFQSDGNLDPSIVPHSFSAIMVRAAS